MVLTSVDGKAQALDTEDAAEEVESLTDCRDTNNSNGRTG